MRSIFLVLVALFFASPSWAAGDSHGDDHGSDAAAHDDHGSHDYGGPPTDAEWKAIGFHAVNFFLMYGLLFALLRKPVGQLLKQRQASIRKELEKASQEHGKAQARLDDLQAKLAGFESELERMRSEALADAERESALSRERTERDVKMLQEMTSGAIREETRNARQQLQTATVDRAIALAEERLRAEISGDDHQRLASDFLGAVRGGADA